MHPPISSLPVDLRVLILLHAACARTHAATQIQGAWRRYRTLVLVGRYRMLRYIHTFRAFNSNAKEFLRRARL